MPLTLRLILYPAFAFFCLLVFSILLFPFDSLKNRFEGEIEKGLGGGFSVTVGKISPALLSGVTLKNLEIRSKKNDAKVKLERAKLKIALFPLLWGKKNISLAVKSGPSSIEGRMIIGKETLRLDLDLDKMDIAIGRILTSLSLPLAGTISGQIKLDLYPTDPLRNAGKVHLVFPDFRLDEGATLGGFPLPSVMLSKGDSSGIDIEVNRGNWEVKLFKFEGGDLQLEAVGKVFAARRIENYRWNLQGTFQPAPGSEEKLSFLSLVGDQKGEDGKYPLSISGKLSKPAIRIGTFQLPI
ncbi:MAG: type II secretion system protein GspN [Deltaproteobacteria bacterium]|nr:type II secretion system protein GspN [Deltaproteobacteria bacterium]MBI2501465.1 type II secretion system protein GspN [Deltaproteobacteria bacterium]